MTFNLRRDVPSDGLNAWSHRREKAAALIQMEQPDVLGTQEGLPHQLADLDARLPAYGRVGRERSGEGHDEACAIYYRKERFELVASGDAWLSDTPEAPGSATWGNRHPRLVTWLALRDRVDGEVVTFANTHLDHESGPARQNAARMIAERFPSAILMGDLNVSPGEAPHAHLIEHGWQDAGSDPTFHGFTGRAWARIDYVLAPPTLRVRSVRVPVAEVSDHHPVVAEIVRA